jgi:hypothetical protein
MAPFAPGDAVARFWYRDMNRSISLLILFLGASLGSLWGLDLYLEKKTRQQRLQDSIFRSLAQGTAISVEQVGRVVLSLPNSDTTWIFRRGDPGWRLPEYHDAFVLGPELDGILKAVLEGRGTIVGRAPEDSPHFGVTSQDVMKLDLFAIGDAPLMNVWVGRIAPGQRARECYMTVEGRASIYHMNSNAWGPLKWTPGSSFPPLLDRRVIPGALGRRFVARITFGGTQAPLLREIVRKDLPMDLRPDRGPRYEWYGTLENGSKKLLANSDTLNYVNSILNLDFDELAESRSSFAREFRDPALTVSLKYDGDATDLLELGVKKGQDRYHLSNATTGQVFFLSAKKVATLIPDGEALLKGGD